MTSAIDELLQRIVDPKTRLSDLLRQALVVSSRIDSPEFNEWVELELSGYRCSLSQLPAYRVVSCMLCGSDSPEGPWEPIRVDEKFSFLLKYPVFQGIPKLEELLGNMPTASSISSRIPDNLVGFLSSVCGLPYFAHQTGKVELAVVVPDVRSELVRRVIKLSALSKGDEGVGFLKQQRGSPMPTNNVVNFYAPSTANVQQGNTYAYQGTSSADMGSLRKFIADVRAVQNDLGLEREAVGELSAELATIEAQLQSPRPKSTVVAECLKTIRNLLEGVASNGLAAALLPALPALIQAVGG